MRLLDRYIGMQILTSALFATGVLSFVLVLGNIFKRLLDLLVNHDVPLDFILQFMAYVLPFSLSFTVPWGFLTAVLLVFGRLSAENELTAMRANGVSLFQIAVPVLVLSVFFTLLCLWINVIVAPRAHERMQSTLFEIATNNPLALFGGDTVIEDFPGRRIYIGGKNGAELQDVFIFEMQPDSGSAVPFRVTHAARARLETEQISQDLPPEERFIKMRLFEARYEERDPSQVHNILAIRHGITMGEGVIQISLADLYKSNQRGRRLGQMTLAELGDLGGSVDERATAALTEISKRFSFSLACFAFGLIAMPLGITAQRRETSIGFALSLLIAFTYFLIIIVADTFRNDAAARPELLVWLPNVIFITLGAILMLRMFRK